MPEIKNGPMRPIQAKCLGMSPCAGTMQFGITIANARKTSTTFRISLATMKRLGGVVCMRPNDSSSPMASQMVPTETAGQSSHSVQRMVSSRTGGAFDGAGITEVRGVGFQWFRVPVTQEAASVSRLGPLSRYALPVNGVGRDHLATPTPRQPLTDPTRQSLPKPTRRAAIGIVQGHSARSVAVNLRHKSCALGWSKNLWVPARLTKHRTRYPPHRTLGQQDGVGCVRSIPRP